MREEERKPSKLTKRTIDAAAPAERRYFLWDPELKGFGLCVHPPSRRNGGGRKIFVLRYFTTEGRDRRMRLGSYGELTPDQARKLAAEMLTRVRAGEDPLATRRELRAAPTVAEVFHLYVEERKPRWKATTRREVERVYEAEVKSSALGRRKIATVRRAEVQRFHAEYQRQGRPTMGNRVLAWLSGAFDYAERAGARPEGSNPCRRIERHPEQRRERFFSLAELKAIGQALDAQPAHRRAAVDAILLLALLGLRRNEVLGLRWSEVDFERRLLALEETKAGRRLKAIGPEALAILERRREGAREDAIYVFPSRRGTGPLRDIRKIVADVYETAKIENATSHHVWRHTFTTHASELGFPDQVIAAMNGHSLGSVTARYAHLSVEGTVRSADERVQRRLWAALRRQPEAKTIPLAKERRARSSRST